jgi:hypothetical protein
MAKRKGARLVSDARPTATNVDFPVFVPNDKGETNIEIGKARLRYGTLVVEFKDTAAAVAIQNAIERGALLGLGTIMLEADVVNEMYQEIIVDEAAVREAQNQALADGKIVAITEDENDEVRIVGFESLVEDKTVDEIIAEYRSATIETTEENN